MAVNALQKLMCLKNIFMYITYDVSMQKDIFSSMMGAIWSRLTGLSCIGCVLCTQFVHSYMHTWVSSSYSTLDWVLSYWAWFTVR